MDKTTTVYKYFSSDDSLLYVGITSRGKHRQYEHQHKIWWRLAVRSELEHFEDRGKAAQCERILIRRLNPLFNSHFRRPCFRRKLSPISYGRFLDAEAVVAKLQNLQGGKSTADFAKVLGISTSFLWDIYSGKRRPGLGVIRHLGLRRVIIYETVLP